MKRTWLLRRHLDKSTTDPQCVICGNEIVGFCNNALPVKDGRCCGACNDTVVIPTRLQKLMDRGVSQM